MAFEQNFQETASHFESVRDDGHKQNLKSISSPKPASENTNGCFECNICLDSAHDPVVTLCGHLYCWPCIYKWLNVQNSSSESDKQPKCPVCKANISNSLLVPLYGRGSSESEPKKPQLDSIIPRRPPPLGLDTLMTTSTPITSHQNPQVHTHQQYFPHHFGNYTAMIPPNFGGTAASSFSSPTAGMFGEMVFARMFGNPDANLFSYPFPNAYPSSGSSSPRVRRQEMQVDKSLNRVSIFLLCCFILCLLLF